MTNEPSSQYLSDIDDPIEIIEDGWVYNSIYLN